MDKILISGIRATGFHGVLPHEREVGQVFVVDCELHLDLTAAVRSDDLTKTVNYAEVALLVREIIEGAPHDLIETLAGKIADLLLKRYRKIEKAVITVHKPEAPIPAEFLDVAVVIERKR